MKNSSIFTIVLVCSQLLFTTTGCSKPSKPGADVPRPNAKGVENNIPLEEVLGVCEGILKEAIKRDDFRASPLTQTQVNCLSAEQVSTIVERLGLSSKGPNAVGRVAIPMQRTKEEATLPSMDKLIQLYAAKKMTQFSGEISQLTHADKLTISLDYLDTFRNFQKADDLKLEQKFNAFLRIMNQLFPELAVFQHFYDKKTLNIMRVDGARVLIQALIDQKKLSSDNIAAVGDIIDLPKVLDALSAKQGDFATAILIKHHRGMHMSPVFVERKDNKVTIIITDSGGVVSPKQWVQKLYKLILKSNFRDAECYAFTYRRQADSLSCGIFSTLDILENVLEDIFKFIEFLKSENPQTIQAIPVAGTGGQIFQFEYLPPRFMKGVQGLSLVQKYLTEHPEYGSTDVTGNGESLAEFVKQNTEPGWVYLNDKWVKKDVNSYLRNSGFEFFEIIFRSLLKKEIEKSVGASQDNTP